MRLLRVCTPKCPNVGHRGNTGVIWETSSPSSRPWAEETVKESIFDLE